MAQVNESPVHTVRIDGVGPFVFVCEHASNRIPDQYQRLGVSQEIIESHAGWDIGALELSQRLSLRYDSPLIASTVSRLVYDCNRAPESTTAIVVGGEQGPILGNLELSDEQRRHRADTVYYPFSHKLSELLDERHSRQIETTLVTMHSFTPIMYGKARAVEIGVLHDSDAQFADHLLNVAAVHPDYRVERNQPYGPDDDVTHTLKAHAITRNMRNVMLEVRNDLLLDVESINRVSDYLFKLLGDALQLENANTASKSKGHH